MTSSGAARRAPARTRHLNCVSQTTPHAPISRVARAETAGTTLDTTHDRQLAARHSLGDAAGTHTHARTSKGSRNHAKANAYQMRDTGILHHKPRAAQLWPPQPSLSTHATRGGS